MYSGAVGNILKDEAANLTGKHFGVYFNVIAMSEDEFRERTARGESADIYSYPLGFEYSDKLMRLDENELPHIKGRLSDSGRDNGILYAVLYLYSGYCFAENCEINKSTNSEAPLDSDFLNNILKYNESAVCGNELISVICGLDKCTGNTDRFKSGECEFAVADFRTAGDCIRKYESGKGFSGRYVPCTHFTDLVQFLCINKSIDEGKVSYAYEFINSILSEKVQKKLPEMGAYTVTDCFDTEELRDMYSSIAYDAFSTYLSPEIPNFFEYRRCKDTLFEDSQKALDGDTDAVKRVKERVNEMIIR